MRRRPRVAVAKFASCDGCQLSLLDAEDDLLAICERIELAHFAEASSDLQPGPYDVTFVEGSITTAHDAERIRELRRQSRFLVTIGACATAGGIQALRAWGDAGEWVQAVYPSPEFIATLATSTPIAEHVLVDFELRGCPISAKQLVTVITALAEGRRPRLPTHSVCLDCKRRETVCVMVSRGTPCLGPVTQTGCGAICPAYDRGCYGCFGPMPQSNGPRLVEQFQASGHGPGRLVPLLRNFNATAPDFRRESERLEQSAEGGAR